jgi:hypothetical protein
MTNPIEKTKDAAEAVAHPVDTAKDLAEEVDRGRSPRTPFLALSGVTIVVGALVAIVLAAAALAYILA